MTKLELMTRLIESALKNTESYSDFTSSPQSRTHIVKVFGDLADKILIESKNK